MKSESIRWTRDFLANQCPCGSKKIAEFCCWRGDGCWEKTPIGKLNIKETATRNASCYLSSKANCSTKLTKEHFISRNILEKLTNDTFKFENAGHFFGGKKFVEIGIDGFSSKVLCDNHNSALSPLDAAAGLAFERIEELTKDILTTRYKGFTVNSFHIVSGMDIERWMIKVFYGLVAAGKIRSQAGRIVEPDSLPPILLDALVGDTELEPPLGLYMHSFVGQIRKSGLSFATVKLTDGSDEVGGLILSLGIVNLVLVTSHRYDQTFNDKAWFRHQTLAFNVKQNGSRFRFLFTY